MKIGSTIHFYKSKLFHPPHSPEFVKGTVTGVRRIPGVYDPAELHETYDVTLEDGTKVSAHEEHFDETSSDPFSVFFPNPLPDEWDLIGYRPVRCLTAYPEITLPAGFSRCFHKGDHHTVLGPGDECFLCKYTEPGRE